MIKAVHIALLVAVFGGTSTVAAGKPHLTPIRGRVVAFRPAERIGQVVSEVINRETFLLRLDSSAGEIVKVVYDHYGYSKFPDGSVSLKGRRDRSCDGTYGQFVAKAPILKLEGKSSAIPSVTLVEGFNGLPLSSKLKCYRLGAEGFQPDSSNR